jgi:hypothetical protein
MNGRPLHESTLPFRSLPKDYPSVGTYSTCSTYIQPIDELRFHPVVRLYLALLFQLHGSKESAVAAQCD